MGIATSYVSTWLIKSKRLSVTAVRKLFSGIESSVTGFSILSILVFGYSRVYCATILVLAYGFTALSYGGVLVNPMDLAPNFAATIMSIALVLGGISALVGTRIINATVSVDNSLESWRPMLICLSIGHLLSGPSFILLGSGEIQRFNDIGTKDVESRSESEQLNKNSC